MTLEGVRALVTGGTSGLGFAMSQALAEAGAGVVLTGRTEQRVQEAATRIGDLVTLAALDGGRRFESGDVRGPSGNRLAR